MEIIGLQFYSPTFPKILNEHYFDLPINIPNFNTVALITN